MAVAGVAIAHPRRTSFGREVAVLLSMIAAVGAAVARGQGPLYEYTFAWLTPLVGLLVARLVFGVYETVRDCLRAAAVNGATIGADTPVMRDFARWRSLAALALLTVAVAAAGMPNPESQGTLAAAGQTSLADVPNPVVLRPSPDGDAFGLEAGLVRILERRGAVVGLTEEWDTFLGFDATPDNDDVSLTAVMGCDWVRRPEPVMLVEPFTPEERSQVDTLERRLSTEGLDPFAAIALRDELAGLTQGRTCLALVP
jgi:hypothetical protein